MTESELRDWLLAQLADVCALEPGEIDVDRPMGDYGLSSRDSVTLAGELEDLLDIDLPSTVLWDHPTIAGLAASLVKPVAVQEESRYIAREDDAVAVIGIGCRLPGDIDDPEQFWALLRDGVDAVSEVPEGRWSDRTAASTTGGYLRGVDLFDAEFFTISPAEARRMDPQQRMLLEVTQQALRDAAVSADALRGSRTGVFIGISGNEYGQRGLADPEAVDAYSATGAALSIAANRISYALDLRGPSMALDTACSSSLVAVHNAVRSLRTGESSCALAGGANLLLGPAITASFDKLGVSAPGGRCRPFSSDADGIVRAEGVGVVVLKRFADARADGDRVLAVIAGSAVNSDGRSNGLTAPNAEAQQAVLRDAYADAGIDPAEVDYVEAHGTGTLLGDPIEARALGAVLGSGRKNPLSLGSVKSNFGHLEAAAGIAGLIKTVLALRHGVVPPTLHYAAPNPHVDFAGLGIEVAARPRALDSGAVAGVSGFGFGGTNAHIVLRQADPVPPPAERAPYRVLLGEVNRERLCAYANELARGLDTGALRPAQLANASARALSGAVRAAVVGADAAELSSRLRALAAGRESAGVVDGHRGSGNDAVWVFSGHGSQWAGMGRELLHAEPAFAAVIDELEPLLAKECGFSLRAAISADNEPTEMPIVQPMLFAMQVALAEMWRDHGHQPRAVLGHSVGEIAAAVVSGALTKADGVRVIATRSRLLDRIAGKGSMATVALSSADVELLLANEPAVTIAVFNSPTQTVVAGASDGVERIVDTVASRGLFARMVKSASPGHCAILDPLVPTLAAELADLEPAAPRIPCYRTNSVDPHNDRPFDARYWADNFREPVRFSLAIEAAIVDGADVFVEVSPHPTLSGAIADVLAANRVRRPQVIATMRKSVAVVREFHTELARLELAGLVVPDVAGEPAALPITPWQHRSHWVGEQSGHLGEHPLLGTHVRLPTDNSHVWQRKSVLDAEQLPWLDGYLGAAEYLEMAIAAGATAFGAEPSALVVSALRLERPLPIADDALLCSTLRRTGRTAEFSVTSRVGGAPARIHATATISLAVAGQPSTVDGSRVPVRRGQRSSRWRVAPDVLSQLLAAANELDTARSHGDLDTAVSACGSGDTRVLVDAEDKVLFEVTGVNQTERPEPPVALAHKVYGIRWQEAPLATEAELTGDVLVLGAPEDARVAATATALRTAGAEVRVAGLGELPVPLPRNVVVQVPVTVEDEVARGHEVLATMVDLVRALVDAGAAHTRLWLMTENAAALSGDDAPVDPVAGALRATIRVLAFEQPELRASWCDTSDPADIVAELRADGAEDEIAWRGGNRYAARVSPMHVPVDADAVSVVRPDGGYVVSGGLGGLGILMARWLSESGAARVVLNGRSAPNPFVRQEIADMRAAGTDVVVVLGDLAEPETAHALIAAAGEGGVPVRGVVHAAAVIDDRVTVRMDADLLAKVWRPKAAGAWWLHKATTDIELDFWLAFASGVGMLGYPGHAAYSPANACVDAVVARRRTLGLPATAIDWGVWSQAGQAAQRELIVSGISTADPVENIEAMEAILHARLGSIGVMRPIGEQLLELSENLVGIPFFADLIDSGDSAEADWPGVEALRGLDNARALLDARLTQRIAGILGVAEDGFDGHSPLTSLGVDSLVAVRIRNSVQHDFEALLPPSLLLRGASIAEVGDWLAGEVLGADNTAAVDGAMVLIPPRDAAERLVAAVCTRVLSRAVGMTQHFTEIAAQEMIVEIAEQLTRRSGHVVTTADLLRQSSIERAAELVREAEHPDQPLRILREGDGQRPLFLFHPGGGDTMVYRQLVDKLDPGVAVYGLDRIDTVSTIEDRVRVYLPMLREIQPSGPYRLGGWSFGGSLAYEMGRQLAEAGEEVELVAMIDTILPKPIPEGLDLVGVLELRFHRFSDFLRECYGMEVELPFQEMARRDDNGQVDLLIETIEAVGLINAEVAPAIIRHQRTSYLDALALQRYQPVNFPGRVVLYSVSEIQEGGMKDPLFERHDPAKGWDEIRGTDVEIVAAPGHHLSVLDPPNVHTVAAHLGELLTQQSSMIH